MQVFKPCFCIAAANHRRLARCRTGRIRVSASAYHGNPRQCGKVAAGGSAETNGGMPEEAQGKLMHLPVSNTDAVSRLL
jgi:glutamate-1-semialdehyde aminotransferase